jgi:GcrA cell cycle regulator
MSWTDERVETLKRMWAEGQSASQIAKELGGVTRNAVIGKVHRLGLSNRAGEGASMADEAEAAAPAAPKPEVAAKPAEPAAPKPAPKPAAERPAPAAAPVVAAPAFGQRDFARGAGLGPRSGKARQETDADGTDRTDLQMADRRSGNRGFLVLRSAVHRWQTLLRGPCRRRLPADERAAGSSALSRSDSF